MPIYRNDNTSKCVKVVNMSGEVETVRPGETVYSYDTNEEGNLTLLSSKPRGVADGNDITISMAQHLSSGEISFLKSFEKNAIFHGVNITADVDISETITITYKSPISTGFDTLLVEKALVSESEYSFSPDPERKSAIKGSGIQVGVTNNNSSGEVSVSMHYEWRDDRRNRSWNR